MNNFFISNKKTIYDILGISILAISSHLYHSDIYKNLIAHKTDTFPNKDNVFLIIADKREGNYIVNDSFWESIVQFRKKNKSF